MVKNKIDTSDHTELERKRRRGTKLSEGISKISGIPGTSLVSPRRTQTETSLTSGWHNWNQLLLEMITTVNSKSSRHSCCGEADL